MSSERKRPNFSFRTTKSSWLKAHTNVMNMRSTSKMFDPSRDIRNCASEKQTGTAEMISSLNMVNTLRELSWVSEGSQSLHAGINSINLRCEFIWSRQHL